MTPVFIDQFYWARRVDALRVGVGFSAPLKSIRAAALGAAIRTCVSDGAVRARARSLGAALAAERPGAERAADVVAEVARQRLLALVAADHPSVTGAPGYAPPPTPAPLRRGHSLSLQRADSGSSFHGD